ncbi:MAG: transglycosylase domain-containing protein [Bulleidia sp.]
MKKRFRAFVLVLLLVSAAAGFLGIRSGVKAYRNAIAIETPEPLAEHVLAEGPSFAEIDPDFVHAVTATEDQRFFVRRGFDWLSFFRAMLHNLRAGRVVEGGSTISQQIAKNFYFQDEPRGLEQKGAEVLLMYRLEFSFSKEELFAVYADMNYYGDGCWGIEEAAWHYSRKPCSDLSAAQAAMLAGIPNAPSIYQLSDGYEAAKKRQEWVLHRMLVCGYLNEEDYADALCEDVHPFLLF